MAVSGYNRQYDESGVAILGYEIHERFYLL